MCTEVIRVSHQRRKVIRCPMKRCECAHTNYCHGPGGCGGGIRQGCVERLCNCTTFVLSKDQTPNPKRIDRMVFTRHQGPNGND